MTSKKETIYSINKLIKQYQKRSQNVQEQSSKMTQEKDIVLTEGFLQIEILQNEEMLIEEFISDLKDLLEDIQDEN